MTRLLLLFSLVALGARGDTLTFTAGGSANGVVSYRDGVFQMRVEVRGKTADVVSILADKVKSVTFNSEIDNPGPLSSDVIPRGAEKESTRIVCEAILKDRSKHASGRLELIDDTNVRIAGVGIGKERVKALTIKAQSR